jgi:hypothetical protein
MTHSVLRVSTAALGVAAFVLFPLSTVRADTPPSGATPSLSEPPTVEMWMESGPDEATVAQHLAVRHHVRHYARYYAWRDGRRAYTDNPVAAAATGLAGGVADLGSLAAYPFYCFVCPSAVSVLRRVAAG